MGSVKLRDVRKSFGNLEAIKGISIEIMDGEFVALVGPSGCGKSTLLRLIAGLEELSGGDVVIDGAVVNDEDPKGRNIAMVFQNYALYPHMTIRENISLNLKISRLPKEEIEERTLNAAQLLSIQDLLDRYPSELSGGQRQRVAMGRAIVRDPSVFLFDEPLSNLDAKLRVKMRAEIKKFHKNAKKTSIYVTHDQIEAMTLADRVVVLNGGHVEQIGSPLQLYRDPDNTFVAGFMGSPAMNMFRGVFKTDGRIELNGGEVIELSPNFKIEENQAVVVGIRPESIVPDPETGSHECEILNVEPTGASTHLTVNLFGQEATVVVDGQFDANAEERLKVGFTAMSPLVFDERSGNRIRLAA